MTIKAVTTATTKTTRTLQALYRANLGLLGQKLDLISVLRRRPQRQVQSNSNSNNGSISQNDEYKQKKFSQTQYNTVCPIVKATIGQHIRHSMDHIQLVTELVSTTTKSDDDNDDDSKVSSWREVHYDRRTRGGLDEHDIDEAERRIKHVEKILQEQLSLLLLSSSHPSSTSTTNNNDNNNQHDNDDDDDHHHRRRPQRVNAYFMLSGDPIEFELPTTVERELGFAAHHAIHHLAMVKIIAETTLKIPSNDLPIDFGKAPSTIVFESSGSSTGQQQQQQNNNKNTN